MALTIQLKDSWIAVSIEDYQKTTKKVSEVINSVLYRPLGFPIVILGKKLKLTPNFFTTLSLISMLISAFFYSQGLIYIAAPLLFLKQILDCVDGSLARLTKQFSKSGALYDFIADIGGFIAVIICMGINEYNIDGSTIYFLYYILMAISVAIGTIYFNNLKASYTNSLSSKKTSMEKTIQKSSSNIKLNINLLYNKLHTIFHKITEFPDISAPLYSSINNHYLSSDEKQQTFEKYFGPLIKIWSFISGATSITIIIVLSLFDLVRLAIVILPAWIFGGIIFLSYVQWLISRHFKKNYQI